MPDVLGFEVQGSKQGRPQGAQFTVAPPQHFLYFFPEPHGHGSFRPTLGALRRGSDVRALALTRRCSRKYRYAPRSPAAMYTMSSSPVEGVGVENRFLHSRLGVSPRQDASEEAVRSTSSVKVSCLF
jgi:hypothetical protein